MFDIRRSNGGKAVQIDETGYAAVLKLVRDEEFDKQLHDCLEQVERAGSPLPVVEPGVELEGLLGCGDGPASFNAEWRATGGKIVSIDPIYQYPADAIESRIDASNDPVQHGVAEKKSIAPQAE